MAGSFDEVIISVWRQTLVQNEKVVELADKRYFVKRTSRHRFRQVDFTFDGQELRGIEQNPDTRSRWARLAREKKFMQFLRNWALCGCGCRRTNLHLRAIASRLNIVTQAVELQSPVSFWTARRKRTLCTVSLVA